MSTYRDSLTGEETGAPAAESGGTEAGRSAYYTLAVLTAVSAANILDKSVVGVVLTPVKLEFGLTDGQLGLLTGAAFAASFALVVIPFGIAADRFNRRRLLALCMSGWSLATMACGFATSFVQLLAFRLLVGAGEAGAGPASMSMISDLFPARRRAFALATYQLGAPVGSIVALGAGAWVTHTYGWRAAMLMAGVPGLLITLLLLATVREPVREGATSGIRLTGAGEAVRHLFRSRALLHVVLGITTATIMLNGVGIWSYVYFTRTLHMPPASAGLILALCTQPLSFAAILYGGVLTDRLALRDERWRTWLPAIVLTASVLPVFGYIVAPSWPSALPLKAMWALTAMTWYGAGYGLVQTLTPAHLRGTMTAIVLLLTNLVGFGVGPLITGVLSDALQPALGDRALPVGMAVSSLTALWAAGHFLLAGRRLAADLDLVNSNATSSPYPTAGRTS
jgi:MFS family permease